MASESENRNKLKAFFTEEYQALKSYVNYRINSSVSRDAEDIIQDVALKLFSGADRYAPINNVAGFVYYSIRNKIIDIMRGPKQAISQEDSGLNLTDIIWAFEEESSAYPEALKALLLHAIEGLKPEYRDLIIAYDFEGYSYKEISIETGISQGTLMSRRHRAIGILHKTLDEHYKLKTP